MAIDRTIEPPIKDAVDFEVNLKPCEQFTLDNGTPVYSIDAGAEEVVMVELVFHAGNWYEDKNIVAATTNHLLKTVPSARMLLRSMSILNFMVLI